MLARGRVIYATEQTQRTSRRWSGDSRRVSAVENVTRSARRWPKNKKEFTDTGNTRTGCLDLLHADRLAAPEPAAPTGPRLDALFAAPAVRLQLQRCPYYHFDSFKRHHYLSEGISKSCWCWELTLEGHGRPIGFHSVIAHLGVPGSGEGSSGASREHRVVIEPDHQGIGLGWMLAETVAAQLTSQGRRLASITMHPSLGGCRDRSPRWRPTARNHKADKDEACTDVPGRSAAQQAGTWAPTTRDKPRVSYRHEYVGEEGAERDTILANLSAVVPKHNCKIVGCGHCTNNRAEFEKRLDMYKLSPTKELAGTCWVTGGPAPLTTPRPPVGPLRREARGVTARLEAVAVEGGRGPRSKEDRDAEKAAAQEQNKRAREAKMKFDWATDLEGDWARDASGAWVVAREDRGDFVSAGDALIGTKIWRNVQGTALAGEVIGVGRLLVAENNDEKVACVRVVHENGFQQDLYNHEGNNEFGEARAAFQKWEAFKARDASDEDVAGGNWTRDAATGAWTPPAQDAGAFLLSGERIGALVRTNVTLTNGDDVPCDGEVIGVGRVQAEDGTYQACTRVAYKLPENIVGVIQEDLWETEFQVAWKASKKWEKKRQRAAAGGSLRPAPQAATDSTFLPGDRVEVINKGGGTISTVTNPVPQRSRRRAYAVCAAPTMYSVAFDTGPAAGRSEDLTLDQLLRGVPKSWSAQKRRRRRDDCDLDDCDNAEDADDMMEEFGGPAALEVGQRVEVRKRLGRKEEVWVLGRVKKLGAGYDVVFDDGRVEACEARFVRPAAEDGLHLLPVPAPKKRPAAQKAKPAKRAKPAAKPRAPKLRLPAFEGEVGADVDAKFGARWFHGTVDALVKNGAGKLTSYETRWSNDDCNRIAPTKVRAHERGTPDG